MNGYLHQFDGLLLWRPDVLLCMLLLGTIYLAVIGPLRNYFKRATPASISQRITFGLVLVILYIAMGSPLNLVAERCLFTAYVLQMLLITQVVPPLLFLALPTWILESLTTVKVLNKFLKVMCKPIVTLPAYNLVATVCLLPGVFQRSLSNDLVHFVLQSALIVCSVFLWWPLMSRVPTLPRLTPGAQLIYLLFAANFMMPIAVFLFFSGDLWYPVYKLSSAQLGIPPLEDQQIGSLLMVTGMLVIYSVRALPAFVSHSDVNWYR